MLHFPQTLPGAAYLTLKKKKKKGSEAEYPLKLLKADNFNFYSFNSEKLPRHPEKSQHELSDLHWRKLEHILTVKDAEQHMQ